MNDEIGHEGTKNTKKIGLLRDVVWFVAAFRVCGVSDHESTSVCQTHV
jgi:hypothetical protein